MRHFGKKRKGDPQPAYSPQNSLFKRRKGVEELKITTPPPDHPRLYLHGDTISPTPMKIG
jgi:hypothetical protein